LKKKRGIEDRSGENISQRGEEKSNATCLFAKRVTQFLLDEEVREGEAFDQKKSTMGDRAQIGETSRGNGEKQRAS